MHTKIDTMFRTHGWGADQPYETPARHHLQQASDRLRERAAEFSKVLVGLVPVPAFHAQAVERIHDLVVEGEIAAAEAWCQQCGRELGVELPRKIGQPVVSEPAVVVTSPEPPATTKATKK